jgi:uncharacterized membrane protein
MNLLKKLAGISLLIIAAILSLAIVVTFVRSIADSIVEIKKSTSLGISYLLGCIIAIVIFVLITIFLFKKGLKLIKNPKQPEDSLDDIGT